MIEITRQILMEIEEVCDQVSQKELTNLIESLDHDHAIFLDGEGRSGLVIRCFAMRLIHLGYQTYVIGETITPHMKQEDVYIGVSGSGTTQAICYQAKQAKIKGCTCIAITAKVDSELALLCDHVIHIPGTVKQDREKRNSIQLLSSLFDQSLHVIIDTIALQLSYRDQVTNDEATKRHY